MVDRLRLTPLPPEAFPLCV